MRKKEFSWMGLRVSVYENAVWGTCIVYRGSKSNTPTKHFAARINTERKYVRAGKDHSHTHTHTHTHPIVHGIHTSIVPCDDFEEGRISSS